MAVPTIRPAVPEEAGTLRELARTAYARYVQRIGAEPAPMRADYAALVASGDVWVADLDGAVVGLLVLLDRGDHVLLENVAVAPRQQGTGLGALLLAYAEEHARSLGRPEIRLYTNEAMTDNLTYYRRHGYVETHRAVEDGYGRVFFRKSV